MRIEEAKKKQNELQTEAKAMLEHFKLQERIKIFGDVHLTGSYKYGLMVKPDVDYLIFNEDPESTLMPAADFCKELLKDPGIGKTRVGNHFVWPVDSKVPKSIYIGLNLIWKGKVWTSDIHIMKRDDIQDKANFDLGWDEKLTQEQKDTILLIKWTLKEQGRYQKDYSSAEIYRAVMNNAVRTVEELDKL